MTDVELVEHLIVVRRHLTILNQVRALPQLQQMDKLTETLIQQLLTGAQLGQK